MHHWLVVQIVLLQVDPVSVRFSLNVLPCIQIVGTVVLVAVILAGVCLFHPVFSSWMGLSNSVGFQY